MEDILHHTERLAKEYDLLEAVEFYGKGLSLVPKTDFLKIGRGSRKD